MCKLMIMIMIMIWNCGNPIQTVEVRENASTDSLTTTITHTITAYFLPPDTDYNTAEKQIAAISDGDKTTDASDTEQYQVHIGNQTGATITHRFSKSYNKGAYTYYGRDRDVAISTMNGSTVQFMNDSIIVETILISNPTQDITVTPSPSTIFNKVVLTIAGEFAAFYEIEILGDEVFPVGGIYSIELMSSASHVKQGDSLQLSAVVSAINGVAKTVTWRTSDPAVATVNSSGEVSGVSVGTATITATSTADTTQTAELEIVVEEIVVEAPKAPNISTEATITHTITAFYTGGGIDTATQIAAISDGDDTTDASASEDYQVHLGIISNTTITHSFSKTYNTGIYTYYGRNDGNAISAMNGSTVQFMDDTIVVETVTISNATKDIIVTPSPSTIFNKVVLTIAGELAAFYEIEIVGVEVIASVGGIYSIELMSPASYVKQGGSLQLSPVILAMSGVAKTVTWRTNDSSVATVDTNGIIIGVREGTVIITATSTADTTQTAELEILIGENISIGIVDSMETGATITHTITAFYTNVINSATQIAAISDGDDTTDVSGEAYQVHIGNQAGATITHSFSKAYNTGIYTYYGRNDGNAISGMNGNTVKFMIGSTVVETVTITNATKDIIVTPSPSTIFNKVVTTFSNPWSAFYEIEILGVEAIAPVGGVYSVELMSPASYVDCIEDGDTLQLSAVVSAISGVAETVTWRTSDVTVATVNQSGKITGISEGTVTITAISTADITKIAELEILVKGRISTEATITHTITAFYIDGGVDTATQIAAISDGDDTTDASDTEPYQVFIGNQTGATITHSFSKNYNKGVYTYYGRNSERAISAMNGSKVQFMNDTIVVEVFIISGATKDIIVTPSPSSVFNKVVTTFPNAWSSFYEIKIIGVEATQ